MTVPKGWEVPRFKVYDDQEQFERNAVWASEWDSLRDTAYALASRLIVAEKLLLLADEVIETLKGDADNESASELLAAIEQHWQAYPEPVGG